MRKILFALLSFLLLSGLKAQLKITGNARYFANLSYGFYATTPGECGGLSRIEFLYENENKPKYEYRGEVYAFYSIAGWKTINRSESYTKHRKIIGADVYHILPFVSPIDQKCVGTEIDYVPFPSRKITPSVEVFFYIDKGKNLSCRYQ